MGPHGFCLASIPQPVRGEEMSSLKGITLDLKDWTVSSTGLNVGGSQGVSFQFWPLLWCEHLNFKLPLP